MRIRKLFSGEAIISIRSILLAWDGLIARHPYNNVEAM